MITEIMQSRNKTHTVSRYKVIKNEMIKKSWDKV